MRIGRIAAVTAGLILAGGVFGTVAGMAVLVGWGLVDGGVSDIAGDLGSLLFSSTMFGGALGTFLGPVAAWLLMRHVPLGLAVGGTLLGTLTGAGLALLATADPVIAMFWGMAGFALTTLDLCFSIPRRQRRLRES